MSRSRTTFTLSLALLALVLAGFGCNQSPKPSTSVSTVNGVSTISETNNQATIDLKKGATFQIMLHSTYWDFAMPTSDVVKPTGDPQYVPDASTHILGNGTVTETFIVANTGTVTLTAARSSCGKDLACVGDQGNFNVTIVATE